MNRPSQLALLALPWMAPQPATAQDWALMREITPRGYVASRADEPVQVDGRLDEPAWRAAPWSDGFVDIEGSRKPLPHLETRMKILWDDRYLYLGARLEEPHIWGTLTEKNSVIFHDNDFEIFIDPDGDHHNYYELEINALGTIWELALVKPYRDGGPVISPANIDGLRSAVHVEGTLNDASDADTAWSVEVAIPWSGLAQYATDPVPPRHGEQWRMNFSRVQWQHTIRQDAYRKVPDTPENNWVWSPQGVVNMHCPERWGYVQFSTARPGTDRFVADPTLAGRDLLMDVYYAQQAYRRKHGSWARSLGDLQLLAERHPSLVLEADADGFTASLVVEPAQGPVRMLEINHESQIVTRFADR